MMHNADSNDPLDELLASKPIRPSPGFSDKVMHALAQPDALDGLLDRNLSEQSLEPGTAFTERVLAEMQAEPDHKVIGFPSWVVAIGSIAALLVAGALAFAALFTKGWEDAREQSRVASSTKITEQEEPLASTLGTLPTDQAHISPVVAFADMSEWEELLVMQATLEDIAALDEQQGWETVALLVN